MNISNVSFGQLKIADSYTRDILLTKMKQSGQKEAIEKSFNSINEWSGKYHNVYFRILRDGYSGGYTYKLYNGPGYLADDILCSAEVSSCPSSDSFIHALDYINKKGKKAYEEIMTTNSSDKANKVFLDQFM